MLPRLFAFLLLLNAAFFYWGYQREASREPDAPPLPAAVAEIELLSEVRAQGGGAALSAASAAGSVPVGQVQKNATPASAGTPDAPPEQIPYEAVESAVVAPYMAPTAASDNAPVERAQSPPDGVRDRSTDPPVTDASSAPDWSESRRAAGDAVEPVGDHDPASRSDVLQSLAPPPTEAATSVAVDEPRDTEAPADTGPAAEARPEQETTPLPEGTQREPTIMPTHWDLLPRDPYLNDPDMDQIPASTG